MIEQAQMSEAEKAQEQTEKWLEVQAAKTIQDRRRFFREFLLTLPGANRDTVINLSMSEETIDEAYNGYKDIDFTNPETSQEELGIFFRWLNFKAQQIAQGKLKK